MNQADIEKYAFLYFCGEKDREILLGKGKMTLEDLERFSYLTDLLGFQKYHAQIWNTFSGEFKEKFEALEHLYKEAARFDSAPEEACSGEMYSWEKFDDISSEKEHLQMFSKNILSGEVLDGTAQQPLWKNDFLKNVPDSQTQRRLMEIFKNATR